MCSQYIILKQIFYLIMSNQSINSLFPHKEKSEEFNFRESFCQKYFAKNSWEIETLLDQVTVL